VKKSIRLLALSISLLLALSGCSNSGSGTASTASKTGSPYTVKVAWLILTNAPKDLQNVEDAINKITIPKINVKCDLTPIPMASWTTQTNLMMSSGEKLDLSIVYNSGGTFASNVASGKLRPIDDLLSEYGKGITDAISSLSTEYLKPGMINGKTYGVTQLRDLAADFGLCCRKDIADKLGIDSSKKLTVDEVTNICKQVKEKYPDMYSLVPFNVGASIGYDLYNTDPLGDSMGVLLNYGQDNTKVVDWYESSDYAKILNTVHGWYKNGYIIPDAVTNTNNGVALVKSGKAFGFLCEMKPGFANQETQQTGIEMTAISMTDHISNTSRVNNLLWTIPTNCKDPVSSMKFLNMMYTDKDIANLLIYGIKDKDYVVTSENSNIITYPDGVDATNTGWGLNVGWEMGNQFIGYIWKGDSADLWTQLAEFDKTAIKSKAMGFVFDSSSVKSQVTAVTNVVNQYAIGLEDGQSDPAKVLPQFISDLKSNGINDIINAKQKQLDEYLKSQDSGS
jgi:putative aldouronate transport system substrate-binding protein